uniref:Uncharacterized protein n=1 Tax=Panagrolaimus davidi TaxID=227884 RepID=A0A914PH42_9BILA
MGSCVLIDENETAFKWFTGKLIPAEQFEDNIDRRMFDWLHEVQSECSKMEKPCLKLEPSEEYKKLKGSKRKKTHCKNYLSLVDGSESMKNAKNPIPTTLPQMNSIKTRKHLKSIFTSISKPKPKSKHENSITLNGKKLKLTKSYQNSTKTKSLFKMIETEDGPYHIIAAENHHEITKMTLGEDIIQEWIQWDNEKDA